MSALKIYNTLARDKQVFTPIEPGVAKLYVCGMTVYDYCHLGHARVMVVFDLVQRWLRALDYRVTYVRNVTDIDDKIIRRAVENGESIGALTDRFIKAMNEDAAALGVERPDAEPRATAYVPQMQRMIAQLQENGLAYRTDAGDVNYSVRDFPGYGKLSGKSLDDLRAGERVDVSVDKRDPLDFVLWKAAKPSEPEEAKWASPWGAGRPGWHIECSAMATELLGEHFDIHGGGQDLQFPHHENEIAQSEGAHCEPFVNYWMHNGFVRLDNQKMSKSLGNFFTIREVLKVYDAEVIRFFILRTHYRSPLNYSDAHLDDARHALTRMYTALDALPEDVAAYPAETLRELAESDPAAREFFDALNDDFNTPLAFRVLFQLAKEINAGEGDVVHAGRLLKGFGATIGLLQRPPREFLHAVGGNDNEAEAGDIEALIDQRRVAKQSKDFATADRIRGELLAQGIVLEDKPGGVTEWRRA
ncbi:MAG: cysteine--tRNA ligase [Burkholderiaceae bacterium]